MKSAIRNIALVLLATVAAGCTSEDDAKRALSGAGYADVTITGYAWFACGNDDSFATGFTAKGPRGAQVTGAVCSGWFKGNTIRVD